MVEGSVTQRAEFTSEEKPSKDIRKRLNQHERLTILDPKAIEDAVAAVRQRLDRLPPKRRQELIHHIVTGKSVPNVKEWLTTSKETLVPKRFGLEPDWLAHNHEEILWPIVRMAASFDGFVGLKSGDPLKNNELTADAAANFRKYFPVFLYDADKVVIFPNNINPLAYSVVEAAYANLEAVLAAKPDDRKAFLVAGLVYGKFDPTTDEGRKNRHIASQWVQEDDPQCLKTLRVEGVLAHDRDTEKLRLLKSLQTGALARALSAVRHKQAASLWSQDEVLKSMTQRGADTPTIQREIDNKASIQAGAEAKVAQSFGSMQKQITKLIWWYSSNPARKDAWTGFNETVRKMSREVSHGFFTKFLVEAEKQEQAKTPADEIVWSEMANRLRSANFTHIFGQDFAQRVDPVVQISLMYYFSYAYSNGFQGREKHLKKAQKFFETFILPRLGKHHDLDDTTGSQKLEEAVYLGEEFEEHKQLINIRLEGFSPHEGITHIRNDSFVNLTESRLQEAAEIRDAANRVVSGFLERGRLEVSTGEILKIMTPLAIGLSTLVCGSISIVASEGRILDIEWLWPAFAGAVFAVFFGAKQLQKHFLAEKMRHTLIGRDVFNEHIVENLQEDLKKLQILASKEGLTSRSRLLLQLLAVTVISAAVATGGAELADRFMPESPDIWPKPESEYSETSFPMGTEKLPTEAGTPRFYTWGKTMPSFWIGRGGYSQGDGGLHFPKEFGELNATRVEVVDSQVELEEAIELAVKDGMLVRANIHQQDGFFEIPAGWEPHRVIAVAKEGEIYSFWHPLSGLKVFGNGQATVVVYRPLTSPSQVAVGRPQVAETMINPKFFAPDLINDEVWYASEAELEDFGQAVKEARDRREKSLTEGSYSPVMDVFYEYLRSKGIDYGAEFYLGWGKNTPAQQLEGLLKLENMICNQFSYIEYIGLRESGVMAFVVQGFMQSSYTHEGGFSSQKHQIVLYLNPDGTWHIDDGTLPNEYGDGYPQPPAENPFGFDQLQLSEAARRQAFMALQVGVSAAALTGLGITVFKRVRKKMGKEVEERIEKSSKRLMDQLEIVKEPVFWAVGVAVESYGQTEKNIWKQNLEQQARSLAQDLVRVISLRKRGRIPVEEITWREAQVDKIKQSKALMFSGKVVPFERLTAEDWHNPEFWEGYWGRLLGKGQDAENRLSEVSECLNFMVVELTSARSDQPEVSLEIKQAIEMLIGIRDLMNQAS